MFRRMFEAELVALINAGPLASTGERQPRSLMCGRDVWRPFIGARLPPV